MPKRSNPESEQLSLNFEPTKRFTKHTFPSIKIQERYQRLLAVRNMRIAKEKAERHTTLIKSLEKDFHALNHPPKPIQKPAEPGVPIAPPKKMSKPRKGPVFKTFAAYVDWKADSEEQYIEHTLVRSDIGAPDIVSSRRDHVKELRQIATELRRAQKR